MSVNLSLDGFLGEDDSIGLQPAKMLQVFAIVLVPVAIGMLVRRKAEAFTERMRGPVKIASIVVLVAVIVVAIVQERDNVLGYVRDVGLVALLLCVLSLTIGYFVPLAFRIPAAVYGVLMFLPAGLMAYAMTRTKAAQPIQ